MWCAGFGKADFMAELMYLLCSDWEADAQLLVI